MSNFAALAQELNRIVKEHNLNKSGSDGDDGDAVGSTSAADRLNQISLRAERELLAHTGTQLHFHECSRQRSTETSDQWRIDSLGALELYMVSVYSHWRVRVIEGNICSDVATAVNSIVNALHRGIHAINQIVYQSPIPLGGAGHRGGVSQLQKKVVQRQHMLRRARNIQDAIAIVEQLSSNEVKHMQNDKMETDSDIHDGELSDSGNDDLESGLMLGRSQTESLGEPMAKRARRLTQISAGHGHIVVWEMLDVKGIKHFLFNMKQYFSMDADESEQLRREADVLRREDALFRSVLRCHLVWLELVNILAMLLLPKIEAELTNKATGDTIDQRDTLAGLMELMASFTAGRAMVNMIDKNVKAKYCSMADNLEKSSGKTGASKFGDILTRLQYTASVSCFLLAMFHYRISCDEAQCLEYCEDGQSFVPCFILKAYIHFCRGQYAEAGDALNAVIEKQSICMDMAMNLKGVSHLVAGDYGGAQRWLASCYDVGTGRALTHQQLASLYNLTVQKRATAEYSHRHKLLEQLWTTVLSSGFRHSDNNNDKSGGEHKSIRIVPVTSQSRATQKPRQRIPDPVQIMYLIAESALQRKQYEFAVSAYRFLLEAICEGKHTHICWGELHVNLVSLFKEYIYALLCVHEPERALAVCDHILRIYPDDLTVRMYKVDAMICLERSPQECLSIIDESLSLLRKTPATTENIDYIYRHQTLLLNNRAIVQIMLGNKADAEKDLSQALKVDVNRAVLFNKCILYLGAQKVQEATTLWLTMRQIPLDRDALFYMRLHRDLVTRDQVVEQEPIESHVSGDVSEQQLRWMDLYILKSLIERKLLQDAARSSKETI